MTKLESMFNKKLVTAVRALFRERCANGGVCKREEVHTLLAEQFGLPGGEAQDAVLRGAVDGGVFDHGDTQYGNFKGGRGACATGVREVDVEALRKAEALAEVRRANMATARAARAAKLAEAKAATATPEPAKARRTKAAKAEAPTA